jgi:LmbE family N-acetylglucosaminyl deacetylase
MRMLRKTLLFWIVLLCQPLALGDSKPAVMAVFAHPDDEFSVAPLLAKYAAAGHDVHLVVVTSGQIGDSHTDIPRGAELGAAREEEVRCSAAALGIKPPHLLGFMDGGISNWETIPRIADRLREIFEEVRPEVLITWGPDGLTGHPDHRTVSNVVTEVFQHRGRLRHRPRDLFYVAWPESRFTNLPPEAAQAGMQPGLVADTWVTTVIEASEYLEQARQSIQCHKTQWPPAMMEMIHRVSSQMLAGKVYLRRALGLPVATPETDLFE